MRGAWEGIKAAVALLAFPLDLGISRVRHLLGDHRAWTCVQDASDHVWCAGHHRMHRRDRSPHCDGCCCWGCVNGRD